MQYFDKTFWKMSIGFIIIVLLGLGGVYAINHFDKTGESAILNPEP